MMTLYRSSSKKVFAGVCGGLADAWDLNATGIRWVLALTTLFLSGVPAIVYLVLWCILKERPTADVINV